MWDHQLRPDGGQSFVGLAPQQHRVGHQELLERDLVVVGVQHQPLVGRRRLEGAVDGHGVVDDQSSYRGASSWFSRVAVTSRRWYDTTLTTYGAGQQPPPSDAVAQGPWVISDPATRKPELSVIHSSWALLAAGLR